MSSRPIVLVTGANGYIAGPVIAAFLQEGFAVRGTVRSKASAKTLIEGLPQYSEHLEIVEVPDIVAPGAFDAAVQGVHAIAHLASVVDLSLNDPEPVLKVAVEGTRGVLESALTQPSIKSVVLMSSIAAITRHDVQLPYRFTEADWNYGVLDLAHKLGKNTPGPVTYAASKVAGEKAFWDFRDEKKPSFTMTAINPTFVMGPPVNLESLDKISGTNAFILQVFAGQDIPAPIMPNPAFVDVRDVALATVLGVTKSEELNGERLLLTRGVVVPQAAADILREAYPDRRDVIKVGTPGEGYNPNFSFPEESVLDGSRFVKFAGRDYYTVKDTIVDTAKFLEKFL